MYRNNTWGNLSEYNYLVWLVVDSLVLASLVHVVKIFIVRTKKADVIKKIERQKEYFKIRKGIQ